MRVRKLALLDDTSGAVMLFGLFLALFLVGALFMIVSVGDAVLYRRAMQDGTDSGAFAAAVIAAKGMNLHSMLNLAMAAIAGILLVVRSVEVLLEIVIAVLQAMTASIVLAPKAAPLLAVITPAEVTVERIGDGVEQFVRISHDALDVTHHAVQHGYPVLAEARAIDTMVLRGSYDPPVIGGFVVPVLGPMLPSGRPGLPVEEVDVGILCDRAANAIGDGISNVQTKVPRWLMRFLGGAVERALRLGKRRTCAEEVVESPRGVLSSRADDSRVWLGHEEFQYRAFGIGQDVFEGAWATGEHGLGLAAGGRPTEKGPSAPLRQMGRFAFSQSEFYYDVDSNKAEWLWRARWRARLRRFRIPDERGGGQLTATCAAVGRRNGPAQAVTALCAVIDQITVPTPFAH